MNIWKSLLAVCLLIAMFGCGASASKKANQEGAAKQLPRLCVTGTQLMNEQGDTVVLKGVSYGCIHNAILFLLTDKNYFHRFK